MLPMNNAHGAVIRGEYPPFWKSIRRYKKSKRRGQTFEMNDIRSLSLILFGMFLIMTVVRMSLPDSMASIFNRFFSLIVWCEFAPRLSMGDGSRDDPRGRWRRVEDGG